jgi:hypothetical protein
VSCGDSVKQTVDVARKATSSVNVVFLEDQRIAVTKTPCALSNVSPNHGTDLLLATNNVCLGG